MVGLIPEAGQVTQLVGFALVFTLAQGESESSRKWNIP